MQVYKYIHYDCLSKLEIIQLQKQYTPKEYGIQRRRKNKRSK